MAHEPTAVGRTRLVFDGGPWVAGRPLARMSPWAELAVGALVGLVLGGWLLPELAAVRWLGWVGWLLLAPVAALVAVLAWVGLGEWAWLLGPGSLAPLGWALLGAVAADLLQAVVPWPFARRLVTAGLGGPLVAAVVVVGPWLAWTHLAGS